MAAKHLEIAREDGPKAGFNAWIEMMERSGLPQVQARLAEVREQGNKKAQFDYYCNVYGKQIFGSPARNVQNEDTPEGALQGVGEDVQALFKQFLSAIGQTPTDDVSDEDDSLDDVDEDELAAQYTRSSGGSTRTSRASTRNTAQSTRTSRSSRGSNAGNGDDTFAPRNPQDDATSGRLWKLNQLGLLKIVTTPGKAITNGDAHKVLAKQLGNN